MTDHSNRNIHVCPHCGAETNGASNAWSDLASSEGKTAQAQAGAPGQCRHCRQDLVEVRGPEPSKNQSPDGSRYITKFLVIAALLAGLILGLNLAFDALSIKEDFARIGYIILLIVVISSGLSSGKIGRKLKYLSIWMGIFLVLMVGYAYRHDLTRVKEKVVAELVPMKGYQQTPASISFPAASDGHYYIRARVNNVPVTFMADTGASHIVIAPRDARKLGLDPNTLTFDRIYETANGTVRGSSIRLDTFNVGGLHFNEIPASVNEADMRHSLLGMTFFKRLRGYEVRDDVLTLHW